MTRLAIVGDYDSNYIRNDVILTGLKSNQVDFIEYKIPRSGFNRFFIFFKYREEVKKSDYVLVLSSDSSRPLVILCRIFFGKKIIWDAFYSLYDSWVNDRRLAAPRSLKAYYYWFLDWLAGKISHLVLLDTFSHIDYFSKEFGLPRDKFMRVLVGANQDRLKHDLAKDIESVSLIRRNTGGNFLVHFHGKYIPLQGVEYIIRAAKILESVADIKFNLIGSGQTFKYCKQLANELGLINLNFVKRIDYHQLASYIEAGDINLGIFGNTDKAGRVIPSKAFEAMALGKPLITAKTEAVGEIFTDHKNVLLCLPANPQALADAIMEMYHDSKLRAVLSAGGSNLFMETGRPERVVIDLVNFLDKL